MGQKQGNNPRVTLEPLHHPGLSNGAPKHGTALWTENKWGSLIWNSFRTLQKARTASLSKAALLLTCIRSLHVCYLPLVPAEEKLLSVGWSPVNFSKITMHLTVIYSLPLTQKCHINHTISSTQYAETCRQNKEDQGSILCFIATAVLSRFPRKRTGETRQCWLGLSSPHSRTYWACLFTLLSHELHLI